MGEFASQLQATDVARAAIVGLFDVANREETDRAADISLLREAEIARSESKNLPVVEDNAPGDDTPSRRTLLIGRRASSRQTPVPTS
jgi:hypothetical protein